MKVKFKFYRTGKRFKVEVSMLKPLDLQTIIPRSVDLQRLQQIDQVRPVIDQQEMSRETIRQTQQKQEQVNNKEAPEDTNRIRDEDYDSHRKRERRYHRFQDKKKLEQEDAANQAVDSKRGQHIDFKV
jgi:hypothetical protein